MVNWNKPTEHSHHIKIQFFAILECRKNGDIILEAVPTMINPASAGTKALAWVPHSWCVDRGMGHHSKPLAAQLHCHWLLSLFSVSWFCLGSLLLSCCILLLHTSFQLGALWHLVLVVLRVHKLRSACDLKLKHVNAFFICVLCCCVQLTFKLLSPSALWCCSAPPHSFCFPPANSPQLQCEV
jgi:hypothetical protein